MRLSDPSFGGKRSPEEGGAGSNSLAHTWCVKETPTIFAFP